MQHFSVILKIILLHPTDSVAQLVEQLTLNQRVQSSSLCRVTRFFYFAR